MHMQSRPLAHSISARLHEDRCGYGYARPTTASARMRYEQIQRRQEYVNSREADKYVNAREADGRHHITEHRRQPARMPHVDEYGVALSAVDAARMLQAAVADKILAEERAAFLERRVEALTLALAHERGRSDHHHYINRERLHQLHMRRVHAADAAAHMEGLRPCVRSWGARTAPCPHHPLADARPLDRRILPNGCAQARCHRTDRSRALTSSVRVRARRHTTQRRVGRCYIHTWMDTHRRTRSHDSLDRRRRSGCQGLAQAKAKFETHGDARGGGGQRGGE